MKEVITKTYFADDGTSFGTDEIACVNYELNQLYQQSGFRFYIGRKPVKKLSYAEDPYDIFADGSVFDNITRFTIDRDKEEANKKFVDFFDNWFGYAFIEDAYNGRIDAYSETNYLNPPVLGSKYVAGTDMYGPEFMCQAQVNTCPVCGKRKTLHPRNHRIDEYGKHTVSWVCDECFRDPEEGTRKKICATCSEYKERYLSPCASCDR